MIKSKLTIIIPCKNEGNTIYASLLALANQAGIDGTTIIIADSSTEIGSIQILNECKLAFSNLNILVWSGGFPAKARLVGSTLATTEFILFLDADIILTNPTALSRVLMWICANPNCNLLTIPFYTDPKWNWVFRAFEFFQKIGPSFAVGGFQLWKTSAYWQVGGYDPTEIFAEDYSISAKVPRKNFKFFKGVSAYTSPRRFENKGVLYMFRLMLLSYLNRNNPAFFKKHHNYWS